MYKNCTIAGHLMGGEMVDSVKAFPPHDGLLCQILHINSVSETAHGRLDNTVQPESIPLIESYATFTTRLVIILPSSSV